MTRILSLHSSGCGHVRASAGEIGFETHPFGWRIDDESAAKEVLS